MRLARVVVLVSALMVLVAVVPAQAAVTLPPGTLVQNGGFEQPRIVNGPPWVPMPADRVPAWSASCGSLEMWTSYAGTPGYPNEGNQSVELDWNPGCVDSIAQSIATVPGGVYEIRLSFRARGGSSSSANNSVRIDFGDTSTNLATSDTSWTEYAHRAIATSTTSTLRLTDSGYDDGFGTLLDAISVIPVDVELPVAANPSVIVVGRPQPGRALIATSGTWSADPTAFAYRWKRCDADGQACEAIAGATGKSILLGIDDVGHRLRAEVWATNAVGTALRAATGHPTVTVGSAGAFELTFPFRRPVIGGDPQPGQTLTVAAGRWTGAPPLSVQWRRCELDGRGCIDIPGATALTLQLGDADVAHRLRAVVTATTDAGPVSVQTHPTAPVGLAVNLTPPTLTGTPQTGQSLRAIPGTWTNTPTDYTYRWRRCDGQTCTLIPGVTGHTLILGDDDLGLRIRVTVTAINAAGGQSMGARPSAAVTAG